MSLAEGMIAVVVALGAALGRYRPGAALAVVVVAAPLRLPVFASAELATLLLLGVAAARCGDLWRVLRSEPATALAMVAFLGWIAASALWARQSLFVPALLGKWGAVALLCWLVASLDEADGWTPSFVVLIAVVAIAPSSLWALGERLGVVVPLGDPVVLGNRLITLEGVTRGRALFWHPNRLAEFVEGFGLLLVVTATLGVRRGLSSAGFLLAALGVWATGSTAGMAVLYGGAILGAAFCLLPRRARRLALDGDAARSTAPRLATPGPRAWRSALVGAAVAAAAAAAIAIYFFRAHGGVGSRWIVFAFAWNLIRDNPWLGIGAGNWALAVGGAAAGVSRFWFRSHAHSLPLHVLAELGGPGLVLCGAFFATPLWRAARSVRLAPKAWAAIGKGAMLGVSGLLAHDLVHYFLRDAVDAIAPGTLLGLCLLASRTAHLGSSPAPERG